MARLSCVGFIWLLFWATRTSCDDPSEETSDGEADYLDGKQG